VRKNADGSAHVYVEAEAPPGEESNWIPTKAGGQFEVLVRLYGPKTVLRPSRVAPNDLRENKD